MQPKLKNAILTVVILLVVGVIAKPYIPFLNVTDRQFAVTPAPYQAYEQALAENRPVFLEFYADW